MWNHYYYFTRVQLFCSVSFAKVLPISSFWSHHKSYAISYNKYSNIIFLFFCCLPKGCFFLSFFSSLWFTANQKWKKKSFSCVHFHRFLCVCVSVGAGDSNWLFSPNEWKLSPFCHQSHHVVKTEDKKITTRFLVAAVFLFRLLLRLRDIKFEIAWIFQT